MQGYPAPAKLQLSASDTRSNAVKVREALGWQIIGGQAVPPILVLIYLLIRWCNKPKKVKVPTRVSYTQTLNAENESQTEAIEMGSAVAVQADMIEMADVSTECT